MTLPPCLVELQICPLVLVPIWRVFLLTGVFLLLDLVVAGMAEGVGEKTFDSQHGSQVSALSMLNQKCYPQNPVLLF